MRKFDTIELLRGLAAEKPRPLNLRPIPYGHVGSAYSQDTVRITGTKDHIEAWLSHHAAELLSYESATTRLSITYKASTDIHTGELLGTYDCSIRVWARGTNKRGRKPGQRGKTVPPGATPRKPRPNTLAAWLDLLGLTGVPDEVELTRAFRLSCLRTHPDRGGTNEAFVEMHEAYKKLKNKLENA